MTRATKDALEALSDLLNAIPSADYMTEPVKSAAVIVRQALARQDAPLDVEALKQEVWEAVQHPHDGSLHGIDQKQRGVEQAIEYLAATHNISKKGG